ncbi:MAG: hypothetical protein P8J87_17805, partial [Verrucomicrobiales bacterium]|nr:hypothetical protein [Verrucomicrobiales bacterium]
ESDFDLAAEFAKENGRSRARGESIDLLAKTMFETSGRVGLEKWLGAIDFEGENGMDSYKKYAFAEATERIAEKDPEEAESWLLGHLDGGYVDARAMYSVAGAVGGDDRGKRVEWLAELPAGGGRNEAVGWAVDRWAREDATATSEWLSEQELGEAYDPAVRALAGRLAGDDPAAAMSWGNAIEGDRGRAETLWKIGREWIQKDKAGAATWLSENEVPERVLEGLARYLK